MRQLDVEIEPWRSRAEEVARAYLTKRGIGGATREEQHEATPAERDSAPGAAPPTPVSRRRCGKCQTSNDLDAAFCKKCGIRLEPRTCITCGSVNDSDAQFCKKCGATLGVRDKEKVDASA
jgi:ribosomal protein L40E